MSFCKKAGNTSLQKSIFFSTTKGVVQSSKAFIQEKRLLSLYSRKALKVYYKIHTSY